MTSVETLILGAGISGLAYASFSNEECLIVDKNKQVGGLCRTFYEKGYTWDFAGHFFHFSDEKNKKFFQKFIEQKELVSCNKNTKIFYENKYIDYPFQMNIHQLDKWEFIDCLYDLFNRRILNEYPDFEQMLYGKFGQSITEKFLKPYNEKLYACDLQELDKNAMGRFFPYAEPEEIINNFKQKKNSSYNSIFIYPKKGAQIFIDALIKSISKSRFCLETEVIKINPYKKIVETSEGIIKYKKLINTIPLNHFVSMFPEKYIEKREKLNGNKVLVFNIGFDREPLDNKIHWIYYPQKDLNFYRVGFYNNILGEKEMSIYVEIGYPLEKEININEQFNKTITNLKKVGIIKQHEIVAYNSLVINPGYAHITPESIKYVNWLRKKLKKSNIYTIGRYGGWTYCSIEDCINEARNLVIKNAKT